MSKKGKKDIHLDYSVQHNGELRKAQLKMLAMLKAVDDICLQHGLEYWLDRGTLLGAVRHQGFIPWDDDIDISMPRACYDKFIKIAPLHLPDHIMLQTRHTDPGYFNLAAPLKLRDLNSRFIEKHEQGDEVYQQGIFIDIFPYDVIPKNYVKRCLYQFMSKKIWRLLSAKHSVVKMGHNPRMYHALSSVIPAVFLDYCLNGIIKKANQSMSPFVGYGFDTTKKITLKRDDIYPLRRIDFESTQFNVAHRTDVMLTQIYGDYLTLPPESERKLNHCRQLIVDLT